jgi:hypothetical protein
MKTELDKYLGRSGSTGKIQKHIDKDTWLKATLISSLIMFSIRERMKSSLSYFPQKNCPYTTFQKQQLRSPLFLFQESNRPGYTLTNNN